MQDLEGRERLRDLEEGRICIGEDGGDVELRGRKGSVGDGLVDQEADRADCERRPEEEVDGVVGEEVLPDEARLGGFGLGWHFWRRLFGSGRGEGKVGELVMGPGVKEEGGFDESVIVEKNRHVGWLGLGVECLTDEEGPR